MKNIKLGDQVYEGVETVRLDTAAGGTVDFAPYQETFAAGRVEGYNAGKEAGLEEGFDNGKAAGIQAEYDRFWDIVQDKGKRIAYQYAFSSNGLTWTDEIYNPKYPIICDDTNVYTGTSIFNGSDKITDTKVPITISGTRMDTTFYNCAMLKRIPSLTVNNLVRIVTAFNNCRSLEELHLHGTLDVDGFNVQWSPLTPESMKSIISCLKNFTGTDKAFTCTVKFSDTCWAALEADSSAPDGNTWRDYVETTLGWLT